MLPNELYAARQMDDYALVTREPYVDEHARIRVEGEPNVRLHAAARIAAMLNGEADPEIMRLRNIIVETNNILFDGCYDADEIEHQIECHAEDIPNVARKLAKLNRSAMDLVGPVVSTTWCSLVIDLVGG